MTAMWSRLNEIGNQMVGGERAVLYAGAGIFFPAFWIIDSIVAVIDRWCSKRFVALVRYVCLAYQIAFVAFLHPNAEWWIVSAFAFACGFHPIAAISIPFAFKENERFGVLIAYAFATSTVIFGTPTPRLPNFITKIAAVTHALAFLGNKSNDYFGDLQSHALFTLRILSFSRLGEISSSP